MCAFPSSVLEFVEQTPGNGKQMAHLIIVTSKYIALAIGLVILWRLKVKPLLLWAAITTSLAILLIHLYALFPLEQFGYDYSLFWTAGRDVWAGLDPYAAELFDRHPFLNPPTALPLFALFAILPLRLSLRTLDGGQRAAVSEPDPSGPQGPRDACRSRPHAPEMNQARIPGGFLAWRRPVWRSA